MRSCQGGIAWGDTRNCINQLITDPSISSMMFEYRFKGSGELDGHNLGNLMLTALDNLSVRPLDAINLIRSMLKVDVNIIPMTEHPSDLKALSTEGRWVTGETSVDEMPEKAHQARLGTRSSRDQRRSYGFRASGCDCIGAGKFSHQYYAPPLLLPDVGRAIANNKNRAVSVCGKTSHQKPDRLEKNDTQGKKLEWCERACQGRRIDVVLGDEPHPELSEWNCVTTPLASPNRDWRHDRDKLHDAIKALLSD
ncbi:2-phospho-L-lactate transferase CofD family protein [Vibrio sinaloensis]|nr:2-phospho-L-lactate transferase CofD family protein [Vibrio sinaloensis]